MLRSSRCVLFVLLVAGNGLVAGPSRRLVANGSYNEDGSANLETAKRLGWDKVWEKPEPPSPAPVPE